MDTRSWWPVVVAAASTVGCCAVVAALRTSSAAEQSLTEGSVSADAASPPTILLIRHGETDGNRTRTIQVPETPLIIESPRCGAAWRRWLRGRSCR